MLCEGCAVAVNESRMTFEKKKNHKYTLISHMPTKRGV